MRVVVELKAVLFMVTIGSVLTVTLLHFVLKPICQSCKGNVKVAHQIQRAKAAAPKLRLDDFQDALAKRVCEHIFALRLNKTANKSGSRCGKSYISLQM